MSENFSKNVTESDEINAELKEEFSQENNYEDDAAKLAAEAALKAQQYKTLSTISKEKEFQDDEEFIETNLDFAQELDNPDELIESQNQFGFADEASNESFDMSPQPKKYVVAISPENIPFFDKYDPEERADLVNELLTFKQEELNQQDRNYRTKKLTKHLIIAALTTFIGLPIIFTVINKSLEATLNSYREVQNNFEKLYIQKGGVKRKDMTKMRGLEY